jgi:wyosine [tRNA(Phe)-imidazoG37] synthetase (radical SAM superfamily)
MSGRFLFGPVASRRLGRSLGVDLIPPKTCPFDCIYCEVGRTTRLTAERGRFNDPDEILRQLDEFFASGGRADYITFSGSGEPTLSSDLGHLIRESKRRFWVPVAVITNGALLSDPAVRAEIMDADLVIPSLDAVREGPFAAVNRPVAGLRLASIVDGLVAFGREFRGRVWLEVLVVAGVNDADEDIDAIAAAIARIKPERVQLNTVVRPPAESYARAVVPERLEEIAARLAKAAPTEIVAPATLRACAKSGLAPREAVLETVIRRPCTAADLESGLALSASEVAAALGDLIAAGKVREMRFGAGIFYEGADKP